MPLNTAAFCMHVYGGFICVDFFPIQLAVSISQAGLRPKWATALFLRATLKEDTSNTLGSTEQMSVDA